MYGEWRSARRHCAAAIAGQLREVTGADDLLDSDGERFRFRYPAIAALLGLSAALARSEPATR